MRHVVPLLTAIFCICACAAPPAASAPATQPAGGKLPHLQVDVKKKQVRVECESCNAHQDVGLEFFCVATGTNEYESVLASRVKASHLHLALLMIGLEPGEPVKWSESTKKWISPRGPRLHIACEWKKGNEIITVPAYRLMMNHKTKKEAPPFTWVFTGSKVMEDGKYAADAVGYLVSVLNNELTVIDIPDLAGRDLGAREYDRNDDLLPPAGATIWMIIEPAGKNEADGGPGGAKVDGSKAAVTNGAKAEPARADKESDDIGVTLVSVDGVGKIKIDGMNITVERLPEVLSNRRLKSKVRLAVAPGAPAEEVRQVNEALKSASVEMEPGLPRAAGNGISEVTTDEAKIQALKQKWEKAVSPHNAALREAAQAHYEVIEAMRREQQRLIDEADRIQRAIDELQKQYQDMTTPKPEPIGQ